ncbi:MAG TPA: glycosyltransferase [Vicinamibacterales bacterium]|nr:glycosyltransferase [Vicinamibacterales bacterium]
MKPEAAAGRRPPRVALVHDWLTGMRGGEKVLEALCALYPDAPLFTLVHVPGAVSPAIERHRPRASWLSRLPGVRRSYRLLLPLFPAAAEGFDLDGFDLVLSSSHCAVKSVVRPGRARHVSYCHTPMRYVWDQREAYFGAGRLGWPAARALRPILAWLARWDAATSSRVDRYVANSQHVARRIGRYYNRRADVVHPPVDVEFFQPDGRPPGDFALIVSALVPYKRLDLAIEACRLAGVRLRIVGQGPDLRRLRARAGDQVEFLGPRADEEIRELYRACGVVLLPGEEDFGIVPVEAQACGRPVVAAAIGGALETVIDSETGVLVAPGSAEAMADGIARALATRFAPAALRGHAERFGRERFTARIAGIVDDTLSAGAGPMTW